MAGRTGQGVAWATHLWVYVDGTCSVVCGPHKDLASVNAGGCGWPLDAIPGLEVAPTRTDRAVIAASRPLALVDMLRGELDSMIRKALGRLQVHVHVVDE